MTDERIIQEINRWMQVGKIGGHLEGAFEQAVVSAVRVLLAEEREACAKIVFESNKQWEGSHAVEILPQHLPLKVAAEAIRARSKS